MPERPQDVVAVAIERAAFGEPGPDGKMSPGAVADVEAILGQLGGGQPAAPGGGRAAERQHEGEDDEGEDD